MFVPRLLLLIFSLSVGGRCALGGELIVGAASDLHFALQELIRDFEAGTGHTVKLSIGASGNLYGQILNGAPFDVFLSADIEYPKKLDEAGFAEPGSLFPYAKGRLALWVTAGSAIDLEASGIRALMHASVRRIAIANPSHAPYGKAAVAALRHYGIYDAVQKRLVLGENVLQAAQFVQSGAADIGILAYSLTLAAPMRRSGRTWVLPQEAHPDLDQAGLILKRARLNHRLEAATAFRDWMLGLAAAGTLERYGFDLIRERD